MSDLHARVDAASRRGAARFASWDDRRFRVLGVTLGSLAPDDAFLDATLAVLEEGMGLGRVGTGVEGEPPSVVAALVLRLLPSLAESPASDRLRLLALAWNLAEGLSAEPLWLQEYVCARAGELSDPAGLDAFLVRVLTPVLAPAEGRWDVPLVVRRVDPRPRDPDFLPGDLIAVSPRVVLVRDRLRSASMVLVLSDSPLVLPTQRGLPADGRGAGPAVRWESGAVQVAGRTVPVPGVHDAHAVLATSAGFVVVAASDSQQLWVAGPG